MYGVTDRELKALKKRIKGDMEFLRGRNVEMSRLIPAVGMELHSIELQNKPEDEPRVISAILLAPGVEVDIDYTLHIEGDTSRIGTYSCGNVIQGDETESGCVRLENGQRYWVPDK